MQDAADGNKDFAFYNAALLELSARAEAVSRIQKPRHTARAFSPICGSVVEVDLDIDETGRVTAFGAAVDACALTKTVIAVMSSAIIGKTVGDIARARDDLQAMLAGDSITPSDDWANLSILEPVRDYKARHNAILLPFEAALKALA